MFFLCLFDALNAETVIRLGVVGGGGGRAWPYILFIARGNPKSEQKKRIFFRKRNTHCNENLIYVFLFWELRGLSPNFYIHVAVSDLYTPKIGPHSSCSRIGRSMEGKYKSHTDT